MDEPQSRAWSLVRRAINYLDTDPAAARCYLRDACTLLCEAAGRELFDVRASQNTIQTGGLAAWQVRRALDYIEEHLGSKLGTEDIAGAIGLHKSHFSRAFKSSVGSPPMAYVAVRRVERAKLMMSTSAERLADVAVVCGFSDQSHLNRHFQRLVGSAPGRWRRSSRPIE